MASENVAFSPLQINECDDEQQREALDERSTTSETLTEDTTLTNSTETMISLPQTVIAVIKCALGAGSFILPRAFATSGILFSCFGTMLIGIICGLTLYMLSACEAELREKHNVSEKQRLSYPDLGSLTFPSMQFSIGNNKVNIMSTLILSGIIFTSIGVSAVYMTFIISVLMEVFGSRGVNISKEEIAIIIFPIILSLLWIQDYRLLATLCAVGNTSVFAGYLVVITYGIQHPEINGSALLIVENRYPKDILGFFGNMSFLFAIHIVMLPILQKMKQKSDAAKVIVISYSLITAVNITFATISVILFYNSTCPIGSHYLGPCDNILSNVANGVTLIFIKVFICIDLLFTIPMVMSAARGIMEDSAIVYLFSDVDFYKIKVFRFLFRGVLGTVSMVFALNSSNISDVVNLVGGLICSLAGYIFPPVIFLKLMWIKISWTSRLVTVLIFFFGLVVLISTMILIF